MTHARLLSAVLLSTAIRESASAQTWTLRRIRVERFGRPGDGPRVNSMIPEGSLRTSCADVGPDRSSFPLSWRVAPADGRFAGELRVQLPPQATGEPFHVSARFDGQTGSAPERGVAMQAVINAPVDQTYAIAMDSRLAQATQSATTSTHQDRVRLRANRSTVVFEATSAGTLANKKYAFVALRVTAYYTGPGSAALPPTCSPYTVVLQAEPKIGMIVPWQSADMSVRVRNTGETPQAAATLTVTATRPLLQLGTGSGLPAAVRVRLNVPALAPGADVLLSAPLRYRVAGTENEEILSTVVREPGTIPLDGVLAASIERPNELPAEITPKLFLAGGEPAVIRYPSFVRLLGPTGPVESGRTVSMAEEEYNRVGDPGWHNPEIASVRRMALEGAAAEGGGVNGVRRFPETARGAADNLRGYLYALLTPKLGNLGAQAVRADLTITNNPPSREHPSTGFVCIEHAYLITSLLRTLGIPAKETNAFLYGKVEVTQTAGALAWVETADGKGRQWMLQDPYMNITAVSDYISGSWWRWIVPGVDHRLRVWYGVARTPTRVIPVIQRTTWVGVVTLNTRTGKGTRFEMDADALDASPYWRGLPSGWK